MTSDLIWTVDHEWVQGAERCRLHADGDGWRLAGLVTAAYDGAPLDVRYLVEVDADWRTRAVSVEMDLLGPTRTLALERDDEQGWSIDGQPAPDLDACVDVDLGVTPSTNTLPIRRLGLEVGDERELEVAWVGFPELRVEAGRQTYRRLAEHRWRYSSGSFAAELTVDDDGLVVTYGQDLRRRVDLDG
jgi:uncharacterized protein